MSYLYVDLCYYKSTAATFHLYLTANFSAIIPNIISFFFFFIIFYIIHTYIHYLMHTSTLSLVVISSLLSSELHFDACWVVPVHTISYTHVYTCFSFLRSFTISLSFVYTTPDASIYMYL